MIRVSYCYQRFYAHEEQQKGQLHLFIQGETGAESHICVSMETLRQLIADLTYFLDYAVAQKAELDAVDTLGAPSSQSPASLPVDT